MFGLDAIQLIVFAIAVIITGISKSGFAGGLGVVTVPLLSLFMSPVLAVSLMLPTLLLMDAMSLKAWWGKHNTLMLLILVPSGIAGVFVGYFTFTLISESHIRLLLGIVTLLFGIHGLAKFGTSKPLKNAYGGLFGLLGGFTSFVSHAGGPPLNFFLLSQSISKHAYLATAVVFFAAINTAKIPPYIALGQFSLENILLALAFSPIAFVGIRAGIVLQDKLNERVFFKVIYILLILLGISLISRSL